MSRQNQTSYSQSKFSSAHWTNDDSSDQLLDTTELQAKNSQLQIDNFNKSATISQMTKESQEIKQKYEALLNALANPSASQSSSNSTNSAHGATTMIGDITKSYLPDENAEIEIQQWNTMWTHLVAMITPIIPYPGITAQSGNDRRAILVDLVSKLCEAANDPQTEELEKLKKKYAKCKKSLKKLREHEENLLLEIKKNKENLDQQTKEKTESEEASLTQKIKILEDLLQKQIEKQRKLLSMEVKSTKLSMNQNSLQSVSIQQTPIHQTQIASPKSQQTPILHKVIPKDDSEDENENEINLNLNLNQSAKQNFTHENSQQHHQTRESSVYIQRSQKSTPSKNHPTHTNLNNSVNQNISRQNVTNTNNLRSSMRPTRNATIQQIETNYINRNNNKKYHLNDITGLSSDEESEIKIHTKSHSKSNTKNNTKSPLTTSMKSPLKSNHVTANFDSDSDSYLIVHKSKKNYDEMTDDTEARIFQRKTAEAEADEILAKSAANRRYSRERNEIPHTTSHTTSHKVSRKRKSGRDDGGQSLRKRYGTHVNQLVDLTNHLADDYHRLGQYLGTESNGTEFSIDKLSKLHDSLLSVEKQLDSISEL
ncbi:hypothetical protein TRFO_06928 [Tritrichomonas foetus]|uniref:Uncharacterized protein n=1 Tax=Tritrichomonas foetus TaxID=1144522 RepID=A0A1J4JUQ1_9EUKA|nr:hypothetical protein TRFO_06928 [Tritrichomonas foetus]|eukprot:OHT02879.1 hypothetical protein TRFO_06928 [Tritrichomonas foetus]